MWIGNLLEGFWGGEDGVVRLLCRVLWGGGLGGVLGGDGARDSQGCSASKMIGRCLSGFWMLGRSTLGDRVESVCQMAGRCGPLDFLRHQSSCSPF